MYVFVGLLWVLGFVSVVIGCFEFSLGPFFLALSFVIPAIIIGYLKDISDTLKRLEETKPQTDDEDSATPPKEEPWKPYDFNREE